MDKTKTIDATGTLPLPTGTLTFTGYVDLIDQIAKLPGTYECVASRFDAYATGRAPGDIPACESDADHQGVRQLGLPAGRAGRGHRLVPQLCPAAQLTRAPFPCPRTTSVDARCCGVWARAA